MGPLAMVQSERGILPKGIQGTGLIGLVGQDMRGNQDDDPAFSEYSLDKGIQGTGLIGLVGQDMRGNQDDDLAFSEYSLDILIDPASTLPCR